jgi:hypothetical protein
MGHFLCVTHEDELSCLVEACDVVTVAHAGCRVLHDYIHGSTEKQVFRHRLRADVEPTPDQASCMWAYHGMHLVDGDPMGMALGVNGTIFC